jgi:hypothetical protein
MAAVDLPVNHWGKSSKIARQVCRLIRLKSLTSSQDHQKSILGMHSRALMDDRMQQTD